MMLFLSNPLKKQTFLWLRLNHLGQLLLLLPDLLKDGSTAEDHGATEAEQLSRAWARGRKETESRQKASGVKSS